MRKVINEKFDEILPEVLAMEMSVPRGEIHNLWSNIKDFYFIGKTGLRENDMNSINGLIDVSTGYKRKFHKLN